MHLEMPKWSIVWNGGYICQFAMLQPNQMENEHEVEVTKLQIHHCTLYESSPIHEFLTSSTQKWVRQPSLQCCSKTTGLHSCRASIQAPANEQKICMSRFITSFSRHHNSAAKPYFRSPASPGKIWLQVRLLAVCHISWKQTNATQTLLL